MAPSRTIQFNFWSELTPSRTIQSYFLVRLDFESDYQKRKIVRADFRSDYPISFLVRVDSGSDYLKRKESRHSSTPLSIYRCIATSANNTYSSFNINNYLQYKHCNIAESTSIYDFIFRIMRQKRFCVVFVDTFARLN